MWYSLVVTVTAGTPVRLAAIPTLVQRLRIRPLIGSSTAVVYVLAQDYTTALAQAKTANNFIDELVAATATVPGSLFELNRLPGGPPIDVGGYAIDGAHSADTVLCSWEI